MNGCVHSPFNIFFGVEILKIIFSLFQYPGIYLNYKAQWEIIIKLLLTFVLKVI